MAEDNEPKSYTAPHPVYTGGLLTRAGDVFVTSAPKGDDWEEIVADDPPAPSKGPGPKSQNKS